VWLCCFVTLLLVQFLRCFYSFFITVVRFVWASCLSTFLLFSNFYSPLFYPSLCAIGSYPHAQQFYYAVDRGVGNTLTYDAPANLPDYSGIVDRDSTITSINVTVTPLAAQIATTSIYHRPYSTSLTLKRLLNHNSTLPSLLSTCHTPPPPPSLLLSQTLHRIPQSHHFPFPLVSSPTLSLPLPLTITLSPQSDPSDELEVESLFFSTPSKQNSRSPGSVTYACTPCHAMLCYDRCSVAQ
jgi:hypothetical protein